jgi:hypothetical protein
VSLQVNPYDTPALVEKPTVKKAPTNVDEIRQQYQKIERAITSSGIVVGFLALLVGSVAFVRMNDNRPGGEGEVVFAVLAGVLAFGLMGCRRWARWPTIAFSLLMLPWFPLGTLVAVYMLYAVMCRKSDFVLTANYREIRRRTTIARRKTSKLTWAILGLMVAGAAWLYIRSAGA